MGSEADEVHDLQKSARRNSKSKQDESRKSVFIAPNPLFKNQQTAIVSDIQELKANLASTTIKAQKAVQKLDDISKKHDKLERQQQKTDELIININKHMKAKEQVDQDILQ
jgi:hypothetical protein